MKKLLYRINKDVLLYYPLSVNGIIISYLAIITQSINVYKIVTFILTAVLNFYSTATHLV